MSEIGYNPWVSKKPIRSTSPRKRAKERRGEIRERERLAAQLPGGSPEYPIEVASAAVVEIRARSIPCPQCGGQLVLEDHTAEQHEGERLRMVSGRCRQCGAPRSLWFRLNPALPN